MCTDLYGFVERPLDCLPLRLDTLECADQEPHVLEHGKSNLT